MNKYTKLVLISIAFIAFSVAIPHFVNAEISNGDDESTIDTSVQSGNIGNGSNTSIGDLDGVVLPLNDSNSHLKDNSTNNHKLKNLILLCRVCHYKIHYGNRKQIKFNGIGLVEIADKLKIPYYTILDWYKRKQLDVAIKKKLKTNTKMSRKYGMTYSEMAQRFGKTKQRFQQLEKEGRLKEILNT